MLGDEFMLQIDKYESEFGYNFIIASDEGEFEILFAGSLDLHWRSIGKNYLDKKNTYQKFTISKENYFIYSLFEQLYEGVKNCNLFELNDFDISLCQSFEELKNREEEQREMNLELRKAQEYNPERLFKNNAVEWHSDDCEYDKASILKIFKERETFVVTFEKGKENNSFMSSSVRISNSGSRHIPFQSLFMNMYKLLVDYNPELHQVHMEEILYQKKLKK